MFRSLYACLAGRLVIVTETDTEEKSSIKNANASVLADAHLADILAFAQLEATRLPRWFAKYMRAQHYGYRCGQNLFDARSASLWCSTRLMNERLCFGSTRPCPSVSQSIKTRVSNNGVSDSANVLLSSVEALGGGRRQLQLPGKEPEPVLTNCGCA